MSARHTLLLFMSVVITSCGDRPLGQSDASQWPSDTFVKTDSPILDTAPLPDLGPDAARSCEAMDAKSDGGDCAAYFGVFWNGRSCVGYGGCSCVGDDCGQGFESKADCLAAYAHCIVKDLPLYSECDPEDDRCVAGLRCCNSGCGIVGPEGCGNNHCMELEDGECPASTVP